jgi:heat shock protein HslJ
MRAPAARLIAAFWIAATVAHPAAAQSPEASSPGSGVALEKTYWKAMELQGMAVEPAEAGREPHLVFEAGGRLSGSDGCNRFLGSYELAGDAIKFTQMAGTMMACASSAQTQLAFRTALGNVSRYRIVGGHLELYDATGTALARFEARRDAAASPPPGPGRGLDGTSWQLVKLQGADGIPLTPDDPGKYTLDLTGDGRLTARVDCNRARGTWKSPGLGRIAFGPLVLTRAMCPPGSLHDRIVKDWFLVRSYVVRDGHLFLTLKEKGGVLEYEPVAARPK